MRISKSLFFVLILLGFNWTNLQAQNVSFKYNTSFISDVDFYCGTSADCEYTCQQGYLISKGLKQGYHECVHFYEVEPDSAVQVELSASCDGKWADGYGLVLFANDIRNLDGKKLFLIRDNGTFAFVDISNENKLSYIKNWTASEYIYKGTQNNDLKVVSDNKGIHLYINGNMVYSSNTLKIQPAHCFGVLNINIQTIKFDNFSIQGVRRRLKIR